MRLWLKVVQIAAKIMAKIVKIKQNKNVILKNKK